MCNFKMLIKCGEDYKVLVFLLRSILMPFKDISSMKLSQKLSFREKGNGEVSFLRFLQWNPKNVLDFLWGYPRTAEPFLPCRTGKTALFPSFTA